MHSPADAFSLFPQRGSLLPCNPPSFWVELILSTPCSRFDPLSRHSAAFSFLNFFSCNNIVIWTYDFVLFRLDKGGWGFLAYCSPCGAEATLSYSTSTVFSNFSTAASAILLAGLGSAITTATSLPFSYS